MNRRHKQLLSGAVAILMAIVISPRPSTSQLRMRTVKMRVAVDETLRFVPHWEEAVRQTIGAVSDIYEQKFQIKLAITDLVEWSPRNQSGDPKILIEELKKHLNRDGADILVGFSGQSCSGAAHGAATVRGPETVVMMACDQKHPTPEQIFSHELAHLFGALDSKDRQSVMGGGPADRFDAQTNRIVQSMRNYEFGKGHAGISREVKRELAAVYRDAIEADPIHAHAELGLIFLTDGKPVEAVPHLIKAADLDPGSLAIQHNLGRALLKMGKLDEAERRLREAIRMDPDFVQARNDLGAVFALQGKAADAVAELQTAIRMKPDYSAAHGNLGLAFTLQGKFDDAIASYHEALRLDPAVFSTRYNLAQALCKIDKHDLAAKEFQELRRINPEYQGPKNCTAVLFPSNPR